MGKGGGCTLNAAAVIEPMYDLISKETENHPLSPPVSLSPQALSLDAAGQSVYIILLHAQEQDRDGD